MNKFIMPYFAMFLALCLGACASTGGRQHTIEFRHFARDFFSSVETQLSHIHFPVEYVQLERSDASQPATVTSYIEQSDWQYMEGPSYYRCESDCYDIMIYDNAERFQEENDVRVLSFEGVSNGINTTFYFELFDGEWQLVKLEDLGT